MNHHDLDARLRAELGGVARLGVPSIDADALARVGRRERTRRRGLVAAAAVAMAVAIGGGVLALVDRRDTPPQPAPAPADLGRASDAPWWQGRVLRAGGAEVPYRQVVDVRYAAGTTLATVRDTDGRWRVLAVRDGAVEELVSAEGRFPPFATALAADGSAVAWSESTSDRTREVVSYDLDQGRPVGDLAVEVEVGDLTVNSVDTDGRVVWTNAEAYVWRPGTDPIKVAGIGALPEEGPQAWPLGLMYQGMGDEPQDIPGIYGTIDDEGVFLGSGGTEIDQRGAWSPDGGHFAYAGDPRGDPVKTDTTRLWVQGPELVLTEVPVPSALLSIVGWDSVREVVVTVDVRGEPTQVRCDVTAGRCEATDGGPPPGAERLEY